MYFDCYSQTTARQTRPLPPTLSAQCHQLYMQQKLYKPQPTLPIIDHSLYFLKTTFVTWSPYYYILHNLPWKPFLLQEMSGTDFHQTKTRTFCQFVEDYRSKWPPFPLILISSYYWDKKYPFFATPIVYPPPLPLTPPTLLKRQTGA